MKLAKQKCNNCRHSSPGADKGAIICRLNPPQVNRITGYTEYPLTSKNSWCGQWKRQKK